MAIKVLKASDLAKSGTVNMLIYGAPGVGKTTFCSTAANPLLIDVEGGLLSLADSDLSVVQANSIEDVKEALTHAITNGFKTVCIDSLTRYCELQMEQILKEDKKDKPQIQHWGELVTRIKKTIWQLQKSNISTIFVCLEKEIEEESQLSKRPSLNGQLMQSIPGIVDVVGYLRVKADGNRTLCVNPTSKFYAKHRTPIKNSITEDIDPNFQDLVKRIYGVPANATAVGQ